MDLKEKWWEAVDWTDLAQDTDTAGCFEGGIEPSVSRFQASAAV
jgi:hypothetical protein